MSILRPDRNVWSSHPVRRAGLLIDGDDYFRAFYAAAQRAEHYIVLAGWQFDSDTCLLRGPEAEQATLPVTLVKYLDRLCELKKSLSIYLLAWDFHAVFGLEREWMQELRFHWTTNERLQFRFDSSHVSEGCHHQKFAVIDGQLSFLGGLDLCEHRWDDRKHRDKNPLRVSRGAPHKPFHDVQAYLVGQEVSGDLAKLFAARWQAAGGDPIELRAAATDFCDFSPEGALALSAPRVSLSRTDPSGSPTGHQDCHEVRDLYLDAIARSERLIYVETQYFSSVEIGKALAERLSRSDDSELEVVLVLNMEAETLKEEIAVGLAQAQIIGNLRKAVEGTRHQLGIYYTVPDLPGAEPERATYIHSKLMIVDDRFLTVGSANLTNRSTSVDTELNASFESHDPRDELSRSIRAIRCALLEEHVGHECESEPRGLVARLDELARSRNGRLRVHPSPTSNELKALSIIDPQRLPFDPSALEHLEQDRSIFIGGISALWERLLGGGGAPSGAA